MDQRRGVERLDRRCARAHDGGQVAHDVGIDVGERGRSLQCLDERRGRFDVRAAVEELRHAAEVVDIAEAAGHLRPVQGAQHERDLTDREPPLRRCHRRPAPAEDVAVAPTKDEPVEPRASAVADHLRVAHLGRQQRPQPRLAPQPLVRPAVDPDGELLAQPHLVGHAARPGQRQPRIEPGRFEGVLRPRHLQPTSRAAATAHRCHRESASTPSDARGPD